MQGQRDGFWGESGWSGLVNKSSGAYAGVRSPLEGTGGRAVAILGLGSGPPSGGLAARMACSWVQPNVRTGHIVVNLGTQELFWLKISYATPAAASTQR